MLLVKNIKNTTNSKYVRNVSEKVLLKFDYSTKFFVIFIGHGAKQKCNKKNINNSVRNEQITEFKK